MIVMSYAAIALFLLGLMTFYLNIKFKSKSFKDTEAFLTLGIIFVLIDVLLTAGEIIIEI